MKNVLKYLGITAGALVGLVVLAFAVLKLIADEQYKEWITKGVQSATGRALSIDALDLDLTTSLSVRAKNVGLANAQWSDKPEMLSMEELEAEVDLLALLTGVADFRTIVRNAEVFSEINDDGESNWVMGTGRSTATQDPPDVPDADTFGGLPIRPLIRELRIENLNAVVVTTMGGAGKKFQISQFLVETPADETTLRLSGIADTVPIELSGNLGNVDQALDRSPSPLDIEGSVADNPLQISGNWGPIIPDPNLALTSTLQGPSTSRLLALAGLDTAELGSFKLEADVTAKDGHFSLARVVTNVDGGPAVASVEGSISDLISLSGIALNAKARVSDLSRLIENAGLTIPVALPPDVEATAHIHGDLGKLGIKEFDAHVRDEGVEIQIVGSVGNVLTLEDVDGRVTASIDSTSALSKYADLPIPHLGALNLSAGIASHEKAVSVSDLVAGLSANNMDLRITGTVDDVMAVSGINASLATNIGALTEKNVSEIQTLLQKLGVALPLKYLPERVKLNGNAAGDLDTLAINDIEAEIHDGRVSASATGSIANAMRADGIDISVGLKSETTAGLSRYAGMELPELGSINASGRVRSSGQKFGLEDLDAKLDGGNINVNLSGGVSDLVNVEGIGATVNLNIESFSERNLADLERLLTQFGVEAPLQLLPAGANLSARAEGSLAALALNDINAEVRDEGLLLTLEGQIANTTALKGIDARARLSSASLSALSKYAGTELPETDPVTLQATLSDGGGAGAPATLSAQAQTGAAKLDLNGQVNNLDPGGDIAAADIAVEINLTSDSLADFSKLVQTELPDKGPFALSGIVSIHPNDYALNGFEFTLDDQAARGNLAINLGETDSDLSTISGELTIPYLDLSPLLPKPAEGESVAESAPAASAKKPGTKDAKEDAEIAAAESDDSKVEAIDRLFSKDPLPLDRLRKFDADFAVTADRLKLGKTDMREIRLTLALHEGLLSIDPLEGLAGNGTINGKLTMDATTDVAGLVADLVVDDAPMPNFGGGLDLSIKLDGDGATAAELAGGLDGGILIVVRDGSIPRGFVTNFGSGMISFSGGKKEMALECGILRMDIKEGKVDFDDKLAVQLSDVTWRGGGNINLKTEKLDVGIVPKPRKGIGISTGQLAGLVHVGGTLKNPQIQLDPKDVALKYGKYMAYMSTGGLSLLAEAVVNKSQANVDVCKQILAGTIFDENAEATDKNQGDKIDASNQSEAADTKAAQDRKPGAKEPAMKPPAGESDKAVPNKDKPKPTSKNLQ